MKISIIVWDANFRESLHTIQCFGKQHFPENEYELFWVDFYGSNNKVQEALGNYKNFNLIKMNHDPDIPWHLGKCINRGIELCQGDILVIPDGDIVVDVKFLKYISELHENRDDLVIYFRRYDELSPNRLNSNVINVEKLKSRCILTNPLNYAGCLSISRDNAKRINGYEEHSAFSGPGCNGMETYVRLRNAGLSIQWNNHKPAYHPWHRGTGRSQNKINKLRVLKRKYDWIIPYAGMEQSWIIRSRELNLEYRANEYACEKYISSMPALNYFEKLMLNFFTE